MDGRRLVLNGGGVYLVSKLLESYSIVSLALKSIERITHQFREARDRKMLRITDKTILVA